MKVLQVIAGAPVGGAETFFLDSVTALHEEGVTQSVVARDNNAQRRDILHKLDIPAQAASFDKTLYCSTQQKIKRTLRTFQPDIAHYWLGRAGSFALRGPQVNIGWYGGYYDPVYYKNCQHHVAVTQDVADHIIAKGIDSKYVHVLHLYAVCEPAAPLNRADFDTPEGVPLLLSLARLHQMKALDVLIEAMASVPDAYLWMAGTGPLEEELKAQAKELGLMERIKFLGWRTDREALLATADICVFPSRYESFGAVTIESWAAGTPLIAAKAQGPKAYITHEENGLLVDVDDVAGLSAEINRLILNPDLQNSLARNGLKSYQDGFTKDVFKKNILALYEQVLR